MPLQGGVHCTDTVQCDRRTKGSRGDYVGDWTRDELVRSLLAKAESAVSGGGELDTARSPASETFDSSEEAEASGTPAVRVEALSKTYGSGEDAVTAIDDVSFEIGQGEIVGLLGPNGAGKTTAIKSMLGLVIPDDGTVEICGIDRADDPRAAYAHVEAMMEGARNQYWRLTVRENVEYFASISGEDPAAIRDHQDRLLDAFGLRKFADAQVRTLSRGMKQKVSIASTLARDVDVVFLDEPTLGLDVESSFELRRQIEAVAEDRDLTILLTSHDMDVVRDLCDRVVIVDDGEVIVDDTIESLLGMFEAQGYRITARGIDPSVVSGFDGVGAVETIADEDDRVRFDVTADSEAFYRLVGELEARDAKIDAVETMEPDLEEAFVEVTGGDGE